MTGRPGADRTQWPADPFTVLGLPQRAELTDDEVRGAWRRIAAATHPDREDGGDPQLFAAAAGAYTALRTRFGRGEILADLAGGSAQGRGGRLVPGHCPRWAARVRGGRPGRLGLRILVTAAASLVAVFAAGWHPAAPALITGAVTWLIRTARRDLAPPR